MSIDIGEAKYTQTTKMDSVGSVFILVHPSVTLIGNRSSIREGKWGHGGARWRAHRRGLRRKGK